ncbi:hypothetical protein CRG98_004112, partial [Punica granatum]
EEEEEEEEVKKDAINEREDGVASFFSDSGTSFGRRNVSVGVRWPDGYGVATFRYQMAMARPQPMKKTDNIELFVVNLAHHVSII